MYDFVIAHVPVLKHFHIRDVAFLRHCSFSLTTVVTVARAAHSRRAKALLTPHTFSDRCIMKAYAAYGDKPLRSISHHMNHKLKIFNY